MPKHPNNIFKKTTDKEKQKQINDARPKPHPDVVKIREKFMAKRRASEKLEKQRRINSARRRK